MWSIYLQGLLLGVAYVAPIGMQNLYLINTALTGNKLRAYQVAMITIFFDITLALACFFGIGLVLKKFPFLKMIILILGSFLVIYIGISLIRASSEVENSIEMNQPFVKIIVTCFVVTWLNPQALIDGSLLLGSYSTIIAKDMTNYFIMGFTSASFIWFLSIASIVLVLRTKINAKVVQGINVLCGILLIIFGVKLGINFFEMI